MTTPERMGRSLLCVLIADVLTALLFQVVYRVLGAEVAPFYGFLVLALFSLPIVLPAWVCWLPVVWLFGNPRGPKLIFFIVIGVLWGPAYLYCLRFRSILARPHLWLTPTVTDGAGMVCSTLATFFYLDAVKRSHRLRIQATDYDR